MGLPLPDREKINSTYCTPEDRFRVSLVVGYDEASARCEEDDEDYLHLEAAALALSLTRDGGSGDTMWHVYDRKTGQEWFLEQDEFEDRVPEQIAGA